MPARLIRLGAQLAVAALCALAMASPALAQGDPDAQIRALVDGAYDDYDNLRLDEAEGRLRQATDIATRSGSASSGAAEAWLMLGVVEHATTGDAGTVLNHFVQALLIDPSASLHPYYATPTLQELLDQAREFAPAPTQQAQTPPPQQPVQQQPPPQPVQQAPAQPIITHAPALEAQAGMPVMLTATVPITIPVSRVVINFRRVGDPQFVGVDMVAQPDGVTFIGEIPGAATRNAVQIEYYITVQDRAGQVLGTAGNPQQPIRTVVFGGVGGDVDLGRSNSRDRDRDRSRSPRDDGGSDEVFHFGFGGGTGFGLATGDPNVYFETVQINPGFAVTPLHLGFELGWVPTRSLHLVPFLRTQLVILETGIEPLMLGGLKIRYFIRDEGPFRVHVGGGIGYGEVSHLVYLAAEDAYDTTNEGPFHIGAGLGLLYMFNGTVGLHNEFYTMVMFDQVSLQIDWTLGLYFAF